MTGLPPLIAVDWGTTNRRAYLIVDGETVGKDLGRGVRTATLDYPAEIASIRRALGDYDVLCAGMVGSTLGWRPVPYVETPASVDDLASAMIEVAPRVWIVPGVATVGTRPDVMRGEEVHFIGAAILGVTLHADILCQPGTHTKWATVSDGSIIDCVTSMTGELFALLRERSTLSPFLNGTPSCRDSFAEGVHRAANGHLLRDLFSIRVRGLLNRSTNTSNLSLLSGLLIGHDVLASTSEQSRVTVIDEKESWAYRSALELTDRIASEIDSASVFATGAREIWINRIDRR